MMLLAALIVMQGPASTGSLARTFRPNQKTVYQVESSVKSTLLLDDGTVKDVGDVTQLEFQLELQTPKKLPEADSGVPIVATFRDLFQSAGEAKIRKKGGFGSSNLVFKPTGLPEGIMLDGPIAPFLLPVVCLNLPEADKDGKWDLPPTTIENGLILGGSGTMRTADKGSWVSEGTYTVSTPKKTLASISTSSTFGKDAILEKGSGSFKSKQGEVTFTMRRK